MTRKIKQTNKFKLMSGDTNTFRHIYVYTYVTFNIHWFLLPSFHQKIVSFLY